MRSNRLAECGSKTSEQWKQLKPFEHLKNTQKVGLVASICLVGMFSCNSETSSSEMDEPASPSHHEDMGAEESAGSQLAEGRNIFVSTDGLSEKNSFDLENGRKVFI